MSQIDLYSKAQGILVVAADSSAITRNFLKPVRPSAKNNRQEWVSTSISEDEVALHWHRTSTRKLKKRSSAITYNCAIAGYSCDARLKKVVGFNLKKLLFFKWQRS